MTPTEAVETIAACIKVNAYTIRDHVYDRLAERHLMEPDLLSVLSDPDDARGDGPDQHGRERWFLTGTLHDGGTVEVLVLIDPRPHATAFTIYWI